MGTWHRLFNPLASLHRDLCISASSMRLSRVVGIPLVLSLFLLSLGEAAKVSADVDVKTKDGANKAVEPDNMAKHGIVGAKDVEPLTKNKLSKNAPVAPQRKTKGPKEGANRYGLFWFA